MVTVGSLFSGCGCFDLAFQRAGFRVAWQVEIDPTARDVLGKHWPDVPRHNDVRSVGAHNLEPVDVICGGFPCQDLSVAGKRKGITGERSGLFYELVRITCELRPRFLVWENVPGLLSSFTPTELPPEPVEGREWDMDETSDFEAVLSHLAECGLHGGWRSLDARHFSVPQSRRRLFGVFTRERAGADCCAEILALADGVRRHPAPGGEASAGVARSLTAGTGSQGHRLGADEAPNLIAFSEQGKGHATYQEATTAGAQRAGGGGAVTANLAVFGGGSGGVPHTAAALTAKAGARQDFDTENLVAEMTPFVFNSKQSGEGSTDVAPTLLAMPHDASHANAGGQLAVCVPIDMRQASRGATMTNNRPAGSSGGAPGTGIGEDGDPAPTIAGSHTPAVYMATNTPCLSGDGDPKGRDDGLAFTLKARNGRGHGDGMAVAIRTNQTGANGSNVRTDGIAGSVTAGDQPQAVCVTGTVTHTLTSEGADASEDGTGRGTPIVSVAQNQRGELRTSDISTSVTCGGGKPGEGYPAAMVAGSVRRLTPTECERLMGLPDGWTRYRENGKQIADGPRYRLCGNGIVVSVAEWMARRMMRVFDEAQRKAA